jgi:hypothetical protein
MADSASITILLNAGGNLGNVVDAATGKVLRLGKATQTATNETRQAAQGLAFFGEQGAKAFGSAGSALAKFAGPLGALGGVSAAAGLAMSKALELANERFTELIEKPVRLAEAMREAAKAADDLAKSRDAAVSGNVGKLGNVAEPLVAQGSLALARQISTSTGIPLEDVSKAVQAGGNAKMSPDAIRRLVEGAKLARQSGRMSFDAAVEAGIGNRVSAEASPADVAAGMVNREGRLAFENRPMDDVVEAIDQHGAAQAEARAAHKRKRQQEYDRAQLAWNAGGQKGPPPTMAKDDFSPAPFVSSVAYKPAATAADFASMQANLTASPIVAAVEAQRAAQAAQADLALEDVSTRGGTVVAKEAAAARSARRNPGLDAFVAQDQKLQADMEIAQKAEDAWGWNPWSTTHNAVKNIADERSRRTDAFRSTGGFISRDDAESPEAFMERGNAERARLESAGKAAGVPFGAGLSTVETLLERIALAAEAKSPAPLQEAQ